VRDGIATDEIMQIKVEVALELKITIIYTDDQFSNPITYTFGTIFSILGAEYRILPYSEVEANKSFIKGLLISYGREKIDVNAEYRIHIYQSQLFSRDYGTASSMPRLPLKLWNGLPVIYEGSGDVRELVMQSENLIETNIDIIASSFFMLSRYEESILNVRDQHGRFPASASVAFKENFLTRPIVNEYIDLLWKWIDDFQIGIERKVLWNGKNLAVILTHDVDLIRKYRWWLPPLNSLARTIKRRQLAKSLHYGIDWTTSSLKIKPDPYWNFDEIIELEHKYEFTSSFYFMTGANTKYDRYRYSINNSKVVALIKKLERAAHEVGLHGSYNSFNDYEVFIKEKNKLDQIVSNKKYGSRQHYLRWKTPDTWQILEKAGILYDSSLGYADHNGFRCGVCFPYKPFDVMADRKMDIWELPLIVMDKQSSDYQDTNPEYIFQRTKRLINTVKNHNGVFVLLTHNSSFYRLQNFELSNFYEKVLAYMSEQCVFNSSAQELVKHWQNSIAQ